MRMIRQKQLDQGNSPAVRDLDAIEPSGAVSSLVPREGIIRNQRHEEPLFVPSMVA